MERKFKIVVGITGSSGVIYGIKLLYFLNRFEVETHVVLSKWAEKNIEIETDENITQIKKLAAFEYKENDMAASISSGSFKTNGMIIIPCSMKTLASIANGYDDNLISRAASVTIKENRKLSNCSPRNTFIANPSFQHVKTCKNRSYCFTRHAWLLSQTKNSK